MHIIVPAADMPGQEPRPCSIMYSIISFIRTDLFVLTKRDLIVMIIF